MINNSKMQLARRVSFRGLGRVRIGAVCVKGKSIVNVGYNKYTKSHPLITSRNSLKKLHAEVSAIIGVDRHEVEAGTIYVYRENLKGEIANCRPCCDCQAIMKEVGIRKVYYTDPKEKNFVGEINL